MARQDEFGAVEVSVRNLGGIESQEVTLDQGVTVLTGRNATNRTSLLQAIAAGLGGSNGQLKSDADEGRVELSFGGECYTRRFERENGSVRVSGDPYTDEGAIVDLFGCLLGDNRSRRAVERGDSEALREIIMEPVDTDEISAAIDRRRREIRSLEGTLEEIEQAVDRLPDLQRRLTERRNELEEVTEELESLRETVDEYESDLAAVEEAEDVVEELTETRNELKTVENRLETQRNALESVREERSEIQPELEELIAPDEGLDDAKSELERLQRRERDLESTINSLLSIVEFNEEMLDGDGPAPGSDGDAGAVLDELDPTAKTVTCWTCGTAVNRGAIDDRLDDLRSVIEEKRRERNELRAEIDDRRSVVRERRETRRERTELEARLDDIESEIDERERRIEDLVARRDTLRDEIEALEQRAAESEQLRENDLLEAYQRLSGLEYERGQLEEQIESLEKEIESVSERREERDGVRSELADRKESLAALRSRIEDLEETAIEAFNDHMETLLDLLEYENVERVWIERKTDADRGGGPVPESTFELHVVRSDTDGAVYEDRVDHLSESEREVIGLVVALAGFLAHDAHEAVPMMLLDSLEAIDADRIAVLVEYFAEYAPFLVVALLPEDAEALPDRFARVVMGGAVA